MGTGTRRRAASVVFALVTAGVACSSGEDALDAVDHATGASTLDASSDARDAASDADDEDADAEPSALATGGAAASDPTSGGARTRAGTASASERSEGRAQAEGPDPVAEPARPLTACTTALECDDGLVCNGVEQCDSGECVPGQPPLLDDGDPCTKDLCDEPMGVLHEPWPAGHPCPNETVCDGDETCDGAGTCMAGAPPPTDDLNICTVDGCDPATGPTHTPIPNCDPTPVQGDAPFETRASLIGKLTSNGSPVSGAAFIVTDAPAPGMPANPPRTDVSVTSSSDGSFRLRLTSFPEVEPDRTPPKHVMLRIDDGAHLPAFRDAWLHTGDAVDLGEIKLVARDSAVTNIGPDGGTAHDSLNRIEVIVPAGALSATIPIVITPIPNRDEMPAPLPSSTLTMYGFELEPSGTTFAVPVTVKLTNWRNAPTSIPIPTGYFDTITGRWEHETQATWDGSRFVFQTSHFTPFDANGGRPDTGPEPAGGGGPGPGGPGPGPGPPPPLCPFGSAADLTGGGMQHEIKLPTYRVKGEDFGITLSYNSGLAGGRTLGSAPADYTAIEHSGFAVPTRAIRLSAVCAPAGSAPGFSLGGTPGRCSPQVSGTCSFGQTTAVPLILTKSVAGSTTTETISAGTSLSQAEFGSYVTVPTVSATATVGTGLLRERTVIRAQTPGACLTSGSTFGVSEPDGTRLQTSLEDGPLATIDRHVLVHHRVTSPYGAGWAVREAARVYRAGDVAHLVPGVGGDEVFMPRAHTRSVPYLHDFRGLALARDASTGEIFVARDDSRIDRIDPVTGASTTMLSGLGFPSVVHGLAIAYDGAARKYIVALATQLLEIDSAGTKTVLAARSGGASSSQANVASDGATVFYTDAVVPVIYRVRMTDPSRTMEALSLATGGDVRLFPRTQLSGVQLAEPRGMTVGADGTLYVADRRRNAVYAVSRDAQNAISGSSTVRPVVGDGMGGFIADRGERYPGVALSVREPLGLTTTEDGYVLVISTAGVVLFDPLAQEAEWLFLVGGIDEVRIDPTATRVSILGLTGTSLLSRLDTSHGRLVRFDVDPLSSEFAPTRTLKPLAGGGLELVDTENELVEEFDPAGRLIERKHRTGERILALQYVDATSDKIDRLIDPVGGETVFAYDGGGKLQSITDARGRVAMFTVNDLGDLVSSTQPGPETSSFVYAEHRMTDRTSQGGEHTQYAFRSDGTVQSATKPGGAVTTVDAALSHPPVYGTSGGIEYQASYVDAHGVAHTVMLDRRGQTRRDTYTIDGVTRDSVVTYEDDLFTVLSMNGHSFREDAASARRNTLLRIRSRSVNGVQEGVSTIWDSYGRPEYEHRPPDPFGGSSNNVRRWFFDANGWLMESFAGPANQTQHYERDAAGHVTRIYDASPGFNNPSPTGRETRWTYLPDGLVATRVDHGVTRTFAYDDLGGTKNELGWIDTLGRSTTHTRDPYGNITSTNDGTATTFADFDVRNRVIETRDALGNATTYGYAHAGCGCSRDDLVTSIHTPDLPVDVDWEMAYDSDRRLTSVTDPHGFTESYEYEPTGELKKTIDKLSRATTWTHDALGRAKTMIDTLGRHHGSVYTTPLSGAYSGPSLMAGSADATASSSFLTGSLRAGDYQIGHNAYPVADAPPAISLYRDATFELGFTHYFDVALRTTRKADRSAVAIDSTTIPFTAGPIWDEQSVWSPQTSMPVLQNFASTGAVTATFNRNFWFDATSQNGHRQSGEPYVSETFTRDAGGRVTQLRRRFLPETTGVSIPPDQLSNYTYRPDGRIEQIANPDGTHDFTYDSRALVQTQIVSGEGTYTYGYDELGRNDYLEFPDGHVRRQLFDDVGRITSRCYEYTGGPDTHCYTAQYDAVGNPLVMLDPEGEDVFEYDALDRLKKATRKNTSGVVIEVDDYEYNALGALKKNASVLLAHQRPRLDGGGNADAAVPATTGGQPITLDAGGRVTSLRATTYTWAKKGYLREVQEPTPALFEEYGVDAELRRTQKIRGTNAEFYFYEGLDRVATLNSAGTVTESYLFDGIDHPLRIKQGATIAYYELDLAGNVRALRNSGGSELGGYRYTAFGQTKEDTATMLQPLRWKGRWHSVLNGAEIYDVRARQWAPEVGVFMSIDGYEYHRSTSTLWAWPRQNPVRFRDPTGHKIDPCDPGDSSHGCGGPPAPPPSPSPPPADRRRECFQECAQASQGAYWACVSDNKRSGAESPGCDPPKKRNCEQEAKDAGDQCRQSKQCQSM